jgi:NADPH:quinone reductase-like Zn-dependent oxidoreductase
VTVFHAVTTDLSLPLPWPVPSQAPEHANEPILIWGGSSSVGQYALQILRHWGYTNLLTTASSSHDALLKSLGATEVFDYRSPSCVSSIFESTSAFGGPKFVLDCIGSQHGSLAPIAEVVGKGARVAVLLPVIVRDASDTVEPIYAFDTETSANWADGVVVRGVRTHFYLEVCSKF